MLWWGRLAVIALAAGTVTGAILCATDDRWERTLADRMAQLQQDARLVAGLLTQAASRTRGADETGEAMRTIDAAQASMLVERTDPSSVRLRLFDAGGRLVADSGPDIGSMVAPYPPPSLEQAYRDLERWLVSGSDINTDSAGTPMIVHFPEAQDALSGIPGERLTERADGGVSLLAAVPIRHENRVIGALIAVAVVPAAALQGLPTEHVLGFALAVIALVFGGGAVLLLMPLHRSTHRLAAKVEAVLQRDATAVTAEPGPGGVLRRLSSAVQRVAGLLQTRMEEAELFAREVSHEVKNPLSSLRSAVETAARTTDPDQHKRLMEVIFQDVARLDRLISAITDLNQVEAELTAMPDETVDLAAMADAIVEIENAVSQEEWDAEFVAIRGDGPFVVRGVEARLAQVFRNLMTNARSFSPPGGRIRVALTRHDNAITITCDDDGPGLPPGREETIFGRFYSDRPDQQPFAGHSGLGLSICRQIVTAHRGSIRAENRIDPMGQVVGARFAIVLPATALDPAAGHLTY